MLCRILGGLPGPLFLGVSGLVGCGMSWSELERVAAFVRPSSFLLAEGGFSFGDRRASSTAVPGVSAIRFRRR